METFILVIMTNIQKMPPTNSKTYVNKTFVKKHCPDVGHDGHGGRGEPQLRRGVPGLETQPQPPTSQSHRPTKGKLQTEPNTETLRQRRAHPTKFN